MGVYILANLVSIGYLVRATSEVYENPAVDDSAWENITRAKMAAKDRLYDLGVNYQESEELGWCLTHYYRMGLYEAVPK